MSSDNGKTILVVDDEPEIRKLVGAMVGSFGYKVLTADSGEHALTLYKHHGPFELLITDVVLESQLDSRRRDAGRGQGIAGLLDAAVYDGLFVPRRVPGKIQRRAFHRWT